MREKFLIIAALTGCAAQGDTTVVAVENNELGVTQVEIARSSAGDERLLTIRGFAGDHELALATLRTGTVAVGSDHYHGRELTLRVGDHTFPLVNPSLESWETPEPPLPDVARFVRLHAVADALFTEAGFRFTKTVAGGPTDELAYNATPCSGTDFPTNKGGASSCCKDGTQTFHINAAGKVAYRTLEPNGRACRTSSGSSCTGAECTYGPCGATIEWVQGNNPSYVFTPNSPWQNQCGWQATGVNWMPEAYSGQSLKPPVSATCGCTDCSYGMPTGGTSSTCDSCRGLDACGSGTRAYVRYVQDVGSVCGMHGACIGNVQTCGTGAGVGSTYSMCMWSPSDLNAWCSSSAWENGKQVFSGCM